jgi:hypothetical protein
MRAGFYMNRHFPSDLARLRRRTIFQHCTSAPSPLRCAYLFDTLPRLDSRPVVQNSNGIEFTVALLSSGIKWMSRRVVR